MANAIVKQCINILNFFGKFSFKINKKIRSFAILLCCFYFSYWRYIHSSQNDPFFLPIEHSAIVFCAVLLLFAFLSNDRKISEIKVNKYFFIPYVLLLVLSYIRYVFFGVNTENQYYFMTSVVLTIIFPFIYIIWNNRKDYEYLFDKLAFSYSLVCVLYFINLYFLAKNGNMNTMYGAVRGSLVHPNFLGEMALCSSISSLYLMYRERENKKLFLFPCASFSISVILSMIACCRSALVCIVIEIITMVIYTINKSDNIIKTIKGLIKATILCAIFGFIFYLISKYYVELQIEKENSLINPMMQLEEKLTQTGSLNGFTSGRIFIWKKYIQYLNLLGNERTALLKEFNYDYVFDAHNGILNIAYRYGIPAGIIYTMFLIYVGVYSIKTLFTKNIKNSFNLFLILGTFTYILYDFVSNATSFFYLNPGLLFYFAIIPIFAEDIIFKKNEKNSNNRS